MLEHLHGVLHSMNPPHLVIDCHGVGYGVDVPLSSFYQMKERDIQNGGQIQLFIHSVYREDGHFLFGFFTAREREVFRLLIKINGVGPKIALSILSGLSIKELAQAIGSKDAPSLGRIPGIGSKTADRLILELQGKILVEQEDIHHPSMAGVPFEDLSVRKDLIAALQSLGYAAKEAQHAAKSVPDGVSLTDGIKMALKFLLGG